MNCGTCGKPDPTVHLTEIRNGQKVIRHPCESCAAKETLTRPPVPSWVLLKQFVDAHAQLKPNKIEPNNSNPDHH
jgi:protein-arginine kinase activator protein McsA